MNEPRRRYSKISRRLWTDERFRQLSAPDPNAQTLWLRLLTGPELTNIPGLVPVWEAGLAQALRWPLEGFREAFAEIFREGMAKADWDAGLVWVPKAIEYNRPESPNVVRSWLPTWDLAPECGLKLEAYHGLKAFLQSLPQGFSKAFDEACRKPSPKPKANQEQEQEQEIPPAPQRGEEGVRTDFRIPRSERRLWGETWISAYEREAAVGLGRPWSFDRRQLPVLEQLVETHCADKRQIEEWVGRAALAFTKATRNEEAKLWSAHQPRGLLRWLNEHGFERPAVGAGRPPARPKMAPLEQPTMTPEETAAAMKRVADAVAGIGSGGS